MEPVGSFKETAIKKYNDKIFYTYFIILLSNSVSLKLPNWTPFDKWFGTFRDKLKEHGTSYKGGSEEKVDEKSASVHDSKVEEFEIN